MRTISSSISILSSSRSCLTIASWNINGFRSLLKHDNESNQLNLLLKQKNIDILCKFYYICTIIYLNDGKLLS